MSDSGNVAKSLRERLGSSTEERLGKALTELLENPLLTGAISRAFEAREKAAQAQEVAMGALNLPSAADIERLTRRLRSVSHRLEGIEDGVDRLDRAMTPAAVEGRLEAIEVQLRTLSERVEEALTTERRKRAPAPARTAPRARAQGKGRAGTASAGTAEVSRGPGDKSRAADKARAANRARAAKTGRPGAKPKARTQASPRRKAG